MTGTDNNLGGIIVEMNPEILADLAAAMAAIDPTATRERLAENERQRLEIGAAIETGQADMRTLVDEIERRSRAPHCDADAIADAMMRGAGAAAAAESEAALLERKATLFRGLIGLRRRADALTEQRRAIVGEAQTDLADIGDTLHDALLAEVEAGVARQAAMYANLTAAAAATGSPRLAALARRLGQGLAALRDTWMGEAMIVSGQALQPDEAVRDALLTAGDALDLTRRFVPHSVPFPDKERDSVSFVGGMAIGEAIAQEAERSRSAPAAVA
jgi:hypothetical protein